MGIPCEAQAIDFLNNFPICSNLLQRIIQMESYKTVASFHYLDFCKKKKKKNYIAGYIYPSLICLFVCLFVLLLLFFVFVFYLN